jgi:hypothetical protein
MLFYSSPFSPIAPASARHARKILLFSIAAIFYAAGAATPPDATLIIVMMRHDMPDAVVAHPLFGTPLRRFAVHVALSFLYAHRARAAPNSMRRTAFVGAITALRRLPVCAPRMPANDEFADNVAVATFSPPMPLPHHFTRRHPLGLVIRAPTSQVTRLQYRHSSVMRRAPAHLREAARQTKRSDKRRRQDRADVTLYASTLFAVIARLPFTR